MAVKGLNVVFIHLCGLFQLSRQMKVKLQDAVHNYTGKGVSGRDKALDAIQQLVCI